MVFLSPAVATVGLLLLLLLLMILKVIVKVVVEVISIEQGVVIQQLADPPRPACRLVCQIELLVEDVPHGGLDVLFDEGGLAVVDGTPSRIVGRRLRCGTLRSCWRT